MGKRSERIAEFRKQLGADWNKPNTEWIKCSDHMPEEHKPFLVFSDGDIEVGSHCNNWWIDSNGCKIQNVTHWMPLPEKPKE